MSILSWNSGLVVAVKHYVVRASSSRRSELFPPVILGGLGARDFGDAFSAFQLPSTLAGEER